MLAQLIVLASSDDRFFVTVASCRDTTWPDETLTGNSRVCQDQGEGQASIIVEGDNLPGIYAWDVTRGIESAKQEGREKLTLVVDGFLFPKETGGAREIIPGELFGPKEEVGFVRFWSRERVEFGVNAAPTLAVSHSTHPTGLLNFLSSALAVLSALGVAAGLYEFISRARKRKIGQ